jgi:hypothetical protein
LDQAPGVDDGLAMVSSHGQKVPHPESYKLAKDFLMTNPDLANMAIDLLTLISGASCPVSVKLAIADFMEDSALKTN